MTTLDVLLLPWQAYEAATPLALWLMAEGWLDEDATITLCAPMLWLAGRYPMIEWRQDRWIDAVYALRLMVYLLIGRKIR